MWLTTTFVSWCCSFFGGIPSGHSVRWVPLKFNRISLSLVGFKTLTTRHPRNNVGGRFSYSWGSNPWTNKCFSAGTMKIWRDSVCTKGLSGNWGINVSASGDDAGAPGSGAKRAAGNNGLEMSMGRSG